MIHKIYLLPETPGLGMGTKLLNMFADIGKQNLLLRLRLKVFFKNDKAIGFYEKYGFNTSGTETTDIGSNYVIIDNVMTKELK